METNLGYVDARISTKIAAIEEALNRVLTDDKINLESETIKPGSLPEAKPGAETADENEETNEVENEDVPEFPA